MMMKKKKTRRGEKLRHPMLDQDAKMMSKTQSKRKCYSCRERGHMAYSCLLGNTPKPISIDDDSILRKDGNGTLLVAIVKHPTTHTKAMPKYVAPNLRGLKLV
jgi:hypothetical protein